METTEETMDGLNERLVEALQVEDLQGPAQVLDSYRCRPFWITILKRRFHAEPETFISCIHKEI